MERGQRTLFFRGRQQQQIDPLADFAKHPGDSLRPVLSVPHGTPGTLWRPLCLPLDLVLRDRLVTASIAGEEISSPPDNGCYSDKPHVQAIFGIGTQRQPSVFVTDVSRHVNRVNAQSEAHAGERFWCPVQRYSDWQSDSLTMSREKVRVTQGFFISRQPSNDSLPLFVSGQAQR